MLFVRPLSRTALRLTTLGTAAGTAEGPKAGQRRISSPAGQASHGRVPPLGTHGKSPGANPGMKIGERIGASPLGAESSPSARGSPLPVLPLLLHFRADKA